MPIITSLSTRFFGQPRLTNPTFAMEKIAPYRNTILYCSTRVAGDPVVGWRTRGTSHDTGKTSEELLSSRHSEERSDEESLLRTNRREERFLAALRMTAYIKRGL